MWGLVLVNRAAGRGGIYGLHRVGGTHPGHHPPHENPWGGTELLRICKQQSSWWLFSAHTIYLYINANFSLADKLAECWTVRVMHADAWKTNEGQDPFFIATLLPWWRAVHREVLGVSLWFSILHILCCCEIPSAVTSALVSGNPTAMARERISPHLCALVGAQRVTDDRHRKGCGVPGCKWAPE